MVERDMDKKVSPSAGNGGTGPGYTWTQTLSEVTVILQLPAGTTSKIVICEITDSTLVVKVRGQATRCILDGELESRVKADDCMWNFDGADCSINIYLEKSDKMNWWSCVIKGHNEIDTQLVEPGNSKLDDLDGETRGMVEKMMYDQRQKAAGLPTSEEQEKLKMFEQFKQQHPEMDFSKAKMQ